MTNAEYYARFGNNSSSSKKTYVGNPVRDIIQSYSTPKVVNKVAAVQQKAATTIPSATYNGTVTQPVAAQPVATTRVNREPDYASDDTPSYSSGGGGGYSAPQVDNSYNEYLEALQAQQAALQAQQEAYLAELQRQREAEEAAKREAARLKQEAAQNAYDSNLAALNDAYNTKMSGLRSNLDSTNSQLGLNYSNLVNSLNTSAADQLRQAYVNRMMAEKNIGNQLSAYGLTGGATESVLAGLQNDYANSRSNINTATQEGLTGLNENYQSALASALQNYNNAVNSAEDSKTAYRMQLENDLAQQNTNSYNTLYDGLAQLDSDYRTKVANLLSNAQAQYADLAEQAQNAAQSATLTMPTVSIGETSGSTTPSRINQRSNAVESVRATASDSGLSTADAAEAARILRGIYENGGGLAAITNTLSGRYGLNAAQIYALASQNGINLNTLNY